MAIDPVCGMEVDAARAAAQADYEGQTYLFCSQGCREAFVAEPEKYLKKEETSGGCCGK